MVQCQKFQILTQDILILVPCTRGHGGSLRHQHFKSYFNASTFCMCRLNASHKAAEKYISQFPSPGPAHAAKFVAFIAGSFAALLLAVALVEDTLLERHLYGHTLVYYFGRLLNPTSVVFGNIFGRKGGG